MNVIRIRAHLRALKRRMVVSKITQTEPVQVPQKPTRRDIKSEWRAELAKVGFNEQEFEQIWRYKTVYMKGDRSWVACAIQAEYAYFMSGDLGTPKRDAYNLTVNGAKGTPKRDAYNATKLESIGAKGTPKRDAYNATALESRGAKGTPEREAFYVKSIGAKGTPKRQAYYDRTYGSTPNQERIVENFLVKHLNLIEPGLTFVDRQVRINKGRNVIDIIAKDFLNRTTIIELKVTTAGIGVFRQLAKYLDIYAKENATDLPRGLIVAPKHSKNLMDKIHEDSYIEPKLFVVECDGCKMEKESGKDGK